MSVSSVKTRFIELLNTVGRAALNASYPDDIEFYSLTLELVDSKGTTKDMLIFPVMPTNITEHLISITNVKKTSAGVSVLLNDSFVPFDISLVGNFGTKFRFLLGQDLISASGIFVDAKNPNNVFNNEIKTGYGVYKILERICKTSQMLDAYNKPHKLYYYNNSKNSSYLVEYKDLVSPQSKEQNMMWQYSLNLKAVAPSEELRPKNEKSITSFVAPAVISGAVNSLMDTVKQSIPTLVNTLRGRTVTTKG